MPIRKNNSKVEIPKATLYELYWEKQLDTDEIARKFNARKENVRDRMREHGVPYHRYDNRDIFIFRHRPRRYFYELYWGKDMTTHEIAEMVGCNQNTVQRHFKDENIPMDTQTGNRWFIEGIPHKYKLPSDDPITDIDDPLPNNPDPSKYIKEETSIRFDKHKLYQLHWGCGFSIAEIEARLEKNIDVHKRFREFGIPKRTKSDNLFWEPHKGIPPMYEWPDEDELTNEEVDEMGPTATKDYERMTWRQPQAGD